MGGEGVRQSLIMSWVGEICTVTAVARGFDLFLYFYKAPEDTSAVSSTTQEMEKRVSHNINGHALRTCKAEISISQVVNKEHHDVRFLGRWTCARKCHAAPKKQGERLHALLIAVVKF